MAGVGVAPAEVSMRGPGLHGVVGVVGVGDGELPQRSEVRFDLLCRFTPHRRSSPTE